MPSDTTARNHQSNRSSIAAAFAAGLLLSLCTHSSGAADGPSLAPRSGYADLSDETRAVQDDEFENPGMLWVQEGERLWQQPAGRMDRSCATCHGRAAAAMRGIAARYPRYSSTAHRVINLEQQINHCRSAYEQSPELPYESEPLLALTAFVSRQSKGLPVNVSIDGSAAASFARGKLFFYARRGQLNLSCANCHEQHAGGRLHGETLGQGQTNGFPVYRLLWQTMGSTHRMFAWCNVAVRAEPYALGSQEYVDLELYERWRGAGLLIETPGVRR